MVEIVPAASSSGQAAARVALPSVLPGTCFFLSSRQVLLFFQVKPSSLTRLLDRRASQYLWIRRVFYSTTCARQYGENRKGLQAGIYLQENKIIWKSILPKISVERTRSQNKKSRPGLPFQPFPVSYEASGTVVVVRHKGQNPSGFAFSIYSRIRFVGWHGRYREVFR